MPNRIIRESARTSDTLDQLSDGAERMFWRLTTVADDFGRFEADPRVLLSACFPLRAGRLKVEQISTWLAELIRVGLVSTYRVGSKTYGVFTTWAKHQRLRAHHSKYPAPSSDVTCQQLTSNVPGSGIGSGSGIETRKRKREARTKPAATPLAPAPAVAPSTGLAWESYASAYKRRYQAEPVRNAKVNSQLKAFVARLEAEEAPAVAAFYVGHNAARYVRAGHPVGLLLYDAETLRTQWATGRRVTETEARSHDQRQERGGIAQRLLERAEREQKGET